MNYKAVAFVMMISVGIFIVGCGQHDHGAHGHQSNTPNAADLLKGYPVDYCIVMGDKLIPDEIVTYEHEGKTLLFCCKMCIKDFKKDPEKYLKKLNPGN